MQAGGLPRESVRVERLDHLGVVASVSQDGGIMAMMDVRVPPHDHAEIATGEARAGLIVHGGGFAHRPWSLPPPFFAHHPLDRWCRPGVRADLCHRLTRGRSLEEVSSDGGALVLRERALAVWAQEGRAPRFNPLDPTRCARTGADRPARDEPARAMTPGAAKAHRPDLPPAVCELRVSQDGGGPVLRTRWDGHPSALEVLHERAQALRATVPHSPSPR